MSFDREDFDMFTTAVFVGDTGEITDWLIEHVDTNRDLLKILVATSMMLQQTWPMAMTEGLEVSDTQGFALDLSEAGPEDEAHVVASQILTAALNKDDDAIFGHCRATVKRDEDFAQAVLAVLIGMYRLGLKAIVEK